MATRAAPPAAKGRRGRNSPLAARFAAMLAAIRAAILRGFELLAALALLSIAAALVAAVLSYSPLDPSFNTITTRTSSNLLGRCRQPCRRCAAAGFWLAGAVHRADHRGRGAAADVPPALRCCAAPLFGTLVGMLALSAGVGAVPLAGLSAPRRGPAASSASSRNWRPKPSARHRCSRACRSVCCSPSCSSPSA